MLHRTSLQHKPGTATVVAFGLPLEIAPLQKGVVKINKFGPIILISSHRNIQPWLPNSIVVYNGSPLDLISIDTRVITKAKNLPPSVQSHCLVIKGEPADRQTSNVKQWPLRALQPIPNTNTLR